MYCCTKISRFNDHFKDFAVRMQKCAIRFCRVGYAELHSEKVGNKTFSDI